MKSVKLERWVSVRGMMSISLFAASLLLLSPAQAFIGSSNLARPNITKTSGMPVAPILFGLGRGFGGGLRGGFGRRLGGGFGRGFRRPGFRPGRIFRGRRPGFRRPGFRPGRPFFRRHARRRFFGRRVGGIILGTAIGVAIAGTAPYPPAAGLCWYWSDSRRKYGYWYYCNEPPY